MTAIPNALEDNMSQTSGSLLQNNLVTMIGIGILSALTVGLTLYWLNLFFFRNRWLSVFKEVMPRHKDIVYSIGTINNLDVDQIILKSDFDYKDFKINNDGKIRVNLNNIIQKNDIVQSFGSIQRIDLDTLITRNDFDEKVFQIIDGKITIPLSKIIQEKGIIQSTGEYNLIDVEKILTGDDFPLSDVYIDSMSGNLMSFRNKLGGEYSVVYYDENAVSTYGPIFQIEGENRICPLKPVVVKVAASFTATLLESFKAFIKKFNGNIIVDLSALDDSKFIQDDLERCGIYPQYRNAINQIATMG